MQLSGLTFPIHLILTCFRGNRSANFPVASVIVMTATIQALLVVAGSYVDGTWRLSGGGKGLLVHYGAWATLLTDPLLMLAAAFAYRQFRFALSVLPVPAEQGSFEVRCVMRAHLAFLRLRGNGLFVYLALVAVGVLSWLNNIRQTADPVVYFGHDVYDSIEHVYGFAAHKFMLFTSWVVIYPAVGFVIVSLCFSTRVLLEELRKRNLMHPNVTHPDGCYGLSELGTLNICLLFPYFLAFAVVFAVIITHERAYASAEIPLIVLTVLFLAASIVTVKPLVSHARFLKRSVYRRLAAESPSFGHSGENSDLVFGIERICFGMTSGSPYSRSGKAMLIAMRLTPIALTAMKFYGDHFR